VSLRRRLALLSAVAVALTVLLASGLVYALVRDQLRGDIDDELRGEAERASARVDALAPLLAQSPGEVTVAPAPGPGPPDAGPPGTGPPGSGPPAVESGGTGGEAVGGRLALPPPGPGRAPAVAQVIGANGSVITEPGSFQIPISSEDRSLAESGGEPRLEDVDSNEGELRVLTQPLATGAALQVARSLEDTNNTLSTLVVILAVVSAGGIALAAALGPVVARTALAPAGDVSDAAEEVARTHDLTRRIEVRGSDELGRLSASFNQMMEALEQSETAQRRLVVDASHELRTPLTTLRTDIETLGRKEQLPPAERDRLVADVTGELEELTELVADVVELARLPRVDGGLEREDVALDELARDAVERAERRARGLRFEQRISPSLAHGDRQRLGRAISNMLDNACKWSPPGGTLEIEVADGRVAVRDHGPGFAAEDLPRVFGRFWRSDDARGKPGSGLGLAIVQRVAEEHGGVARAANADGGGAVVSMELPPPPADPEAGS
jgi:two-component system, OmpR family, sensor histidine kinase MprB